MFNRSLFTRRALLQSALLLPVAPVLLTRKARAQENQQELATTESWLSLIAQQLQDEFNLPAVWLASAIEDEVESVAVGVRKIGDQTEATTDDMLSIASVSKPMAGLWIASIVENSKLTYQTRVLDVLPDLEPSCLPQHRDINLGQLVTHTAGVVRDVINLPSDVPIEKYPDERIRQGAILLATPSPALAIDREFYSNNGLTLAVSMAERVAGEPYEIAATRFYRERLGLKSWGVWGADLPNDLSVPWPHTMKNGVATAREPRSVAFHYTRPSGSAHCTIADAARFGLISTQAMTNTNTVLKQSTWNTILASVPNSDNTLGSWFISQSKESYDHSGSFVTTQSNVMVIPDWRVAVAAYTNAASPEFAERATDLMLDAIRLRYAQVNPPPQCRITLLSVDTMDSSWRNKIVPTLNDDKLHVRVTLSVETRGKTGDLKTTVQVGDATRTDNRFGGLIAGIHKLQFTFDTPRNRVSSAIITIDALKTAGNVAPNAARAESTLTVQ